MKTLRLIAAGDISLQTRDGKRPFDKVGEILKNKDILFGNLETVLSNRGKKAEKAVVLSSAPEKVSYLEDAGFDVLNIANNHIVDSGMEGFHDTLEVLRQVRNFNGIVASNGKIHTSIIKNASQISKEEQKDVTPWRQTNR